MELREPIEYINEQLILRYGKYSDGRPNFRVVFSDDQYEKRLTDFTDEGFELIRPEVRLLPKYKQYVREKFILERLLPIVGETDLITKTSYEPAWVFQDKRGNYLPPFFEGCVHIIESLMSKIDSANSHTRYKDKNVSKEEKEAHLLSVERDLFGNETDITDHLSMGSGVTVQKEKEIIH